MLRRAEGERMSRPLRVLIDARMLIGRFSGVARVVTKLAEELAKQREVKVIALLGNRPYAPWTAHDIEVIQSSFAAEDRTPYRRWRWEQGNLPGLIRQAKADVYHATWNSGIPRNADVPCVLTIHDLIPWEEPKTHFAGMAEAWWYRHAVRTSARRAARVTTVSNYVRSAVLARLGLPPEKVIHVPNGVDQTIGGGGVCADWPYVLYVGGHEPRKNLPGVFAAMRRYWERYGSGLELRLTGRAATLPADAAKEPLRLQLAGPVRFLDDIDDQELERHYRFAVALVLLSRAEGFGLPVLEAMAHGCPVIAAARGALPEVVGDAGILVDPDDTEQISAAVFSLLAPSAFRDALIARGRSRAAMLSWTRTAEQMMRVYQAACASPASASVPVIRLAPSANAPAPTPTIPTMLMRDQQGANASYARG